MFHSFTLSAYGFINKSSETVKLVLIKDIFQVAYKTLELKLFHVFAFKVQGGRKVRYRLSKISKQELFGKPIYDFKFLNHPKK